MLSRRRFLQMCGVSLAAMAVGVPVVAAAGSIPVLLYHRIGDSDDKITAKTQRFVEDLDFLQKQGFNTISLKQFDQAVSGKRDQLPENPVLITFDDGYADNYEHAFPELQKRGMTAAFFIISDFVGQAERVTWPQIQEMKKYGMGIGSHTLSHRFLNELPEKEAILEVEKSKFHIENWLGSPVRFFAFPGGFYTPPILEAVKSAGYCGAFSVHYGLYQEGDVPYTIKRIPVFAKDQPIWYILAKRGLLPQILPV